MKTKITFSFLFIFFIISNIHAQNKKSDSLKIDELKIQNQALLESNLTLLADLKENLKTDWVEKMNAWITIGGILGSVLALLGVWLGLKAYIAKRVDDHLKTETEKGLNNLVQLKYGELLRDTELKKNTKILVINEKGTEIPAIFNELLKEYPKYSIYDLEKLDNIKDEALLTLSKNFDLVILEDMVSANKWLINERKPMLNKQEYSNLNPEEIKKKIGDLNHETNTKINEFCKMVSPTTAILYYGDGSITKELIGDVNVEQYISFANTPATLLQNIFNLVKLHHIGKNLNA